MSLDLPADQLAESRQADGQLCRSTGGDPAAAVDLRGRELPLGQTPIPDGGGSCGSAARGQGGRVGYLLGLLKDPDNHLEHADLLYLFLAHFVPNELAERCSKELLDRFGTLGNLLAAPWSRLEVGSGRIGDLAAIVKTVHAMVISVLREPVVDRPVINNTDKLHAYLKVSLGHSPVEMVRVLFLNKKNFLIKDEIHSRGTVDHAPLYKREIVKRLLDLDAHAIILVHNHPTGDPAPSKEDVQATWEVAAALEAVGGRLYDHVIVGRTRAVSFRQSRWLGAS